MNIDLADEEKAELARIHWGERRINDRAWCDIPPAEQWSLYRWWRKQHPKPQPPAPQRDPELVTHGWLKTFMEQFTEALAERLKGIDDVVAKLDDGAANRVEALEKRVGELQTKEAAREAGMPGDSASFERRLSRHAEHLARLEDRMKKLEGKA